MKAVEKRFPRTTWADQASFHVARIHVLHGEWREAATAFDTHAKRYPSGQDRNDAARFRGIAHLMAGDYSVARKVFEELAENESDSVEAARALTMAALASYKDGDHTHAIARWREIATSYPLTWPALVARARLTQVGAPLPDPILNAHPVTPPPPPLSISLPPPVDMLHRIGLDADAEDALRDREAVVIASAPGRRVEALCQAYGEIDRGRRLHSLSLQIPSPLLDTTPAANNEWAWHCAFPSPYSRHVASMQHATNLPHGLIYAVMRQESGFDPDVVSPARAVGLLQLMPDTAKLVAKEAGMTPDDSLLKSPPYNIALGAHYLASLLEKFHGQIPLAVASYNSGPEAIQRWASRAPQMDLDVFVERIPYGETRTYVSRVMGNFARYAYLADAKAPTIKLTMDAK
jgi:soluble lytic murein transglycosylase